MCSQVRTRPAALSLLWPLKNSPRVISGFDCSKVYLLHMQVVGTAFSRHALQAKRRCWGWLQIQLSFFIVQSIFFSAGAPLIETAEGCFLNTVSLVTVEFLCC